MRHANSFALRYSGHNAEWQTLLQNALLAQAASCRSRNAQEEKQAREPRQRTADYPREAWPKSKPQERTPPSNPDYGAAMSAVIAYKFKIEKDFLLAAIVLYKYFEIAKTGCSSYPAER